MKLLSFPVTKRKGENYWNGKALYARDYEKLYTEELVPEMGEADTVGGEAVRCASSLSYEYYNNGNGNALSYNGDIDPYFEKMMDYLRKFFRKYASKDDFVLLEDSLDKIESTILYTTECEFTDEEEQCYVLMMDAVIYIVKNNPQLTKEKRV